MRKVIAPGDVREKRKIWLLLVVLAVMTALVWHEWKNEDPVYKMKPAEFGTTEAFTAECWDAETKTVTADHLEQTGVLTQLEPMQLERGTYQFMVSYNADSENSYVEISSDMEMDEQGNPGVIYAREQIVSEKEGVLLEVTLPEDAVGVTLKVYYGGGYLKVNQIEIRSMKEYTDTLVLYVTFLLFVLLAWLALQKRPELADRAVILLLVLEFLYISTPLWNDFMVIGQDAEIHLGRIRGMYYSLRDGSFPMWINPFQGKGYGYASSIMYPQMFLWIPAVLMWAGVSLLNAYKLLLLVMNLAGVLIAYVSFKEILRDRWAGLAAGAFYCASLYRLGTVYTRGALGESLAMTFLPLFAVGLYQVVMGDERQWMKLALGTTGILSSHVLSSYLYVLYGAAFAVVMAVWKWCNDKNFMKRINSNQGEEPALQAVKKQQFLQMRCENWNRRAMACIKSVVVTVLWNLYFLIPFLTFYRESFSSSSAQNMGSTMHAHGV